MAALLAIAGQPAVAQIPSCSLDSLDLRGNWGQANFTIELADDPEERSRGLMFVESMPNRSGMLFVYPKAGSVGFWMKNTLIPLDMIFVDETGVVSRIHENAIPGDLSTIDGGDGVLMVLEINGGMSKMLGITPGSELRHPLFEQKTAIWPCEGF